MELDDFLDAPPLPKHVICHLRIHATPAYVPFEGPSTFADVEADAAGKPSAEPAAEVLLMPEFANKGRSDEWPNDTNVACFWCCHAFRGAPVGLPSSMRRDGKFETRGCFCSLECAMSFCLNERTSGESRWTRATLLNAMARRTYGRTQPIQPAPPRETLAMFGGYLGIDEFRAMSRDQLVLVDPPPMVSVPQRAVPVPNDSLDASRKYAGFVSGTNITKSDTLVLKRRKPVPVVTPNNFFEKCKS